MCANFATVFVVRSTAVTAMEEAWTRPVPPPWSKEACFTRLLWMDLAPNGRARFHRPDVWHTVNLGVGKSFISSCFAIIQKAMPGRSIGVRFKVLAADFDAFSKAHKLTKFISRFDEKLFGITGNEEPDAGWNKASVTANICRFLEHVCVKYKAELEALDDERTKFIVLWLFPLYAFFLLVVRCFAGAGLYTVYIYKEL